ncbi:MAG TPA: nuclear transport factor 2 family protein [Ohtaekwangia sp.]|nr:nuclear transport factor 2 family protein [Ohtaekwangia sp.]
MESIQDFFTIYKASAWEKDIQRMVGLYDDNVVIFDIWEQGYQTGLTAWSIAVKDWLSSLGDERVNVIFEMVEIHENENVAFGSALITFQAISIDDAIIRNMKNRITLGFIKNDAVWKVVHQHTSAPINSDLKAILDF